jgi:hypothetical protein
MIFIDNESKPAITGTGSPDRAEQNLVKESHIGVMRHFFLILFLITPLAASDPAG